MSQTIQNMVTPQQVTNNALNGQNGSEESAAAVSNTSATTNSNDSSRKIETKVELNHKPEEKIPELKTETQESELNKTEAEVKPKDPDKSELNKNLDNIAFGINCFGVITSACTSLLHAMFKKNKAVSDVLDKIASSVVSLSMGTNSAFNAYNSFRTKNICQLLGYSGELAIAALAPYNYKGLLRGLSFTLYQIPQIIGSGGKKVFKTFEENFEMLKKELPSAIASLFKREGYTGENYERSVGAWGGLVSTLGVFGWLCTGNNKMGGLVKGIGELLLDIFQVAPKQWKLGKVNYGMSGLAFIAGSLCEMISKQLGNEPSTRDLYFVGSGIGRIFMTRSNTLGEFNYDGKNGSQIKPSAILDGLKETLRNGKDKLHSALAA